MAASVWMASSIGVLATLWMVRPRALTIPVVRVWSRPKGLPMAKTFCPTCRSALVGVEAGAIGDGPRLGGRARAARGCESPLQADRDQATEQDPGEQAAQEEGAGAVKRAHAAMI